MINREPAIYHHTIEQLEKPLEFVDMNIISGLMRIAAGPESAKVYRDLKRHIESYAEATEENTALFVARSYQMGTDPEIVGFEATRVQDSSEGRGVYIEGLQVHPTAQGRGYGRALVAATISFASEQGASYIQVDRPLRNTAAHKLFQAMDFTVESSEYPRLELS